MSENGRGTFSISEVAEMIGRKPHTIRGWEREGRLPDKLLPKRDDRDYRYWTTEQVELLRQWMIDVDLRPGKGLHNWREDRAST